jgi:pimeloyl-ACP methyl ester carboxylesterase
MSVPLAFHAADGRLVTGLATPAGREERPLLVCLPGGGYSAGYFDVPGCSLLDAAIANGFSTFALDRPGYGETDALPPGDDVFRRNAERVNAAIDTLWADHGGGRPGVVVIAHSIGAAVTMHLAAGDVSWPLLGVALHGISDLAPEHVIGAWNSMPPGRPVELTPQQRRMFLYGPADTFDPDVAIRADAAAAPCPIEELLEVVGEWPAIAATVAARVEVPVHYVLAEHDTLWLTGQERVDAFGAHFTAAPRVEAMLYSATGHNIDHHLRGPEVHLRQLAFALSCAPTQAA